MKMEYTDSFKITANDLSNINIVFEQVVPIMTHDPKNPNKVNVEGNEYIEIISLQMNSTLAQGLVNAIQELTNKRGQGNGR